MTIHQLLRHHGIDPGEVRVNGEIVPEDATHVLGPDPVEAAGHNPLNEAKIDRTHDDIARREA